MITQTKMTEFPERDKNKQTTRSKKRRVRQKKEYHNELGRPPNASARKTQTNLWEYNNTRKN